MKTKPFLVYPVFLLILVLALDKIFYLPVFQNSFLQTGNSTFYFHRKLLFEKMVRESKDSPKSLVLVYGDSRSYPYTETGLPPSAQSNWSLFNFSTPQAVPMYSYQLLRKTLKSGIKPTFVILSLSPESFQSSKSFVNSPFLRFGAEPGFQEEIWNDLSLKEKWEATLDRVFRIRALEVNLNLFVRRTQSRKWKEYSPNSNPELLLLNQTKGEYLMYATLGNPIEKLERDATRIKAIYLRNFELGQNQFLYVEKFLELAKENQVPVVVVYPKVYETYRKNYENLNLEEVWWSKIQELANESGAKTFHVEKENECNLFNDASHQSAFCFPELMRTIWFKMGWGEIYKGYELPKLPK